MSEREGGFTLIELLVVLIIIAVLLAIAIPAYLGFKDRAQKRAAQANVRISVPTAEAYAQDNNGSYLGLTTAELIAIDAATVATVSGTAPTATNFCIQSTVGAHTYNFTRSANVVATGACA
jgi:type IV pilus assembly protein PilA